MPATLRDLLIDQIRTTVKALDTAYRGFGRSLLDLLPQVQTFTLQHLVVFTHATQTLFGQMFGLSPAAALRSTVGQTIITRASALREAVTRRIAQTVGDLTGSFWQRVTAARTDAAVRDALYAQPLRTFELSDRVWRSGQAVRNAIDLRLRQGIARGESSEVIGRDLRQFLRTPKRVYQQNGRILREAGEAPAAVTRAELLARTELAAAHGAAVRDAARNTPGMAVKWSLGAHKRSDECDDKANGSSDGLDRGVYYVDDAPRYPSHPGCLCMLSPVTVKGRA